MSSSIHIDDLARPRLPWWFAAFNAVARAFAARLVRFDADALIALACRQTGLDDFGPDSFQQPFRVLVRCVNEEVELNAFGRISQRMMLLNLLKQRLRVEALIRAVPAILAEEIARPIVIAGLPRTGTTHLFNLVSQHPGLRSLPYWESLEPIPGEHDDPKPGQPDPRIARCARALSFMNRVMPLFPAMHEFEPEVPHEEVQLQMMEFATQLYEASLGAPASYSRWYAETDQTPHYAYMKRMLQVCQHLRGGRRWILKSPQHLENLKVLFATFPDAYVVQTHRDPVRIVASLATMISYGNRFQQEKASLDPHRIGRHWSQRIERWLHHSIDDRTALPADRLLDVHFHEFMKDDVATATRLLEWAGEPVDAAARDAIARFAARNVQGKHGAIDYPLADVGLDEADLRRRFRFYQDHFGVPDSR